MTIWERIRFYRRLYNLTQEEVSKALSTSRPFISMLENGKGEVSIEYAENCIRKILRLGQAKNDGKMEEVLEELKQISRKERREMDKRYADNK